MNYSYCKFVLTLMLWMCVHNAIATSNGAYFGGEIGYSRVRQGEFIAQHTTRLLAKIMPISSLKTLHVFFGDTEALGRLFMGYQFNSYVAVELGYARFKPFTFLGSTTVDTGVTANKIFKSLHLPYVAEGAYPLSINIETRMMTSITDLTVMGIWPLNKKLNLYGKLGFAYIDADANIDIISKIDDVLSIGISAKPSINMVYPELGLGIRYDINDHFSMNVAFTHLQKYTENCYPNIDFATAGLLYHF